MLLRAAIDAEIVVADNHSTDHSLEIARRHRVRTVFVLKRGYGHAVMGGIHAARGKYVIMADTDGSHSMEDIPRILAKLREGYDLVNGNRFLGGVDPGAMTPAHRIGNRLLTGLGQLLFRTPLRDYNCGLRGFRREAIIGLHLRNSSYGLPTEMILKAALARLRMAEIPTRMHKEGRVAHGSTMHAVRESVAIIGMTLAYWLRSLTASRAPS